MATPQAGVAELPSHARPASHLDPCLPESEGVALTTIVTVPPNEGQTEFSLGEVRPTFFRPPGWSVQLTRAGLD